MRKNKLGLLNKDKFSLATDLYQLTMMACYQRENKNDISTFDMFVRKLPENRNYLIAAGLEQVVAFLENAEFSEEDIDYLRSQELFDEEFLEYLKDWKFSGDLYAIPEGTPVFQNEPLLRVTAKKAEAQLIESYVLSMINYQTSIASKASRIVEAANGKPVVDFALRRCHSPGAAHLEARASYIGGCVGTSNVAAGKEFNLPIKGTMAHSLVMSYDDELEAFRSFANTFKNTKLPLVLLIDTYDTVEGARKAAIIAKELENEGKKLAGVRLDSGNLSELSREVRKVFDREGLDYVSIFASNDLNEYKINKLANSEIDAFGVGTEMGVSKDAPALSGVYKLSEDTDLEGRIVPKIKLSEGKVTYPGKKQVYRISKKGDFVKDVLALEEENIDGEPLLVKVMEQGKASYGLPPIEDIRKQTLKQVSRLPEEIRNPEKNASYEVEISSGLQRLTDKLIEDYRMIKK